MSDNERILNSMVSFLPRHVVMSKISEQKTKPFETINTTFIFADISGFASMMISPELVKLLSVLMSKKICARQLLNQKETLWKYLVMKIKPVELPTDIVQFLPRVPKVKYALLKEYIPE